MRIDSKKTIWAMLALFTIVSSAWSADPPAKKGKADKGGKSDAKAAENKTGDTEPAAEATKLETTTFGSGCFWCGEAVFEQLKGVKKVVSGYSGGTVVNPSYEEVSTGETGHAEVIQITFDPTVVSFDDLLEVFWKSHDPTQVDGQGNDHGTQYRSCIFYHSEEQKTAAEKSKQKHEKPGKNSAKIVTEITKFTAFYPAEDYHQDFFKNNPRYGYCQAVVRPKVNKVKKEFKDKLKDSGEKSDKSSKGGAKEKPSDKKKDTDAGE